ncbi:MAG: sigma-54-dependent Fis family transcriptional regulator [Candidatus Eisenbacteria bacterium]|uniref:Sigma-54-dependent Fis family transcriptional regulator n=1 Tax=Eiseniibacteriota bacterium TaxID=2212470 RepID=A0A956NAK1_UNCEI|nr:sigma-54-dependent Fis family transcriptional regulator [Candidatus Eisenbacteria bacterium]MCB9465226.1 sigma-54-dependent Fis family transcriptional regulator [Candidatus Eisenbacteria bacterium]
MKGTILLVDDEAYVRDALAAVLERRDFVVRTGASAEDALADHALDGVDVVITDLKMPGMDGLELLEELTTRAPNTPVIIITGHGSVVSAVECLKAGAFDFVQKPMEPGALALLAERAVAESAMRRELAYHRSLQARTPAGGEVDEPVGASAAWKRVVEMATRVAPADTSVLLVGESGTGKEELAKLIHRRSTRAKRPFVPVNCGAIPDELFESEFFGHKRGSFPGATEDRDGRFRVAHEGTLFLDEVCCLPEPSQAKVLRVLQDGVFERMGETRPTVVDVRLVAATNSDLESEVKAGRFRKDLYYRIAVLVIEVPPLRERVEDVDLLASRFLERFAAKFGKAFRGIDPSALNLLRAYPWPGNVRELRNVMERAVILETGNVISPKSLPTNLVETGREIVIEQEDLNLRDGLKRRERQLLEAALERAGGVRREAARLLGIDERNLSYFLKKHDWGEGEGS